MIYRRHTFPIRTTVDCFQAVGGKRELSIRGLPRRSALEGGSAIQFSDSDKRIRISEKEADCTSNGKNTIFTDYQKKSSRSKNSSKRSLNAIREVLRGRLESPALSPFSRAFSPERRTKWH